MPAPVFVREPEPLIAPDMVPARAVWMVIPPPEAVTPLDVNVPEPLTLPDVDVRLMLDVAPLLPVFPMAPPATTLPLDWMLMMEPLPEVVTEPVLTPEFVVVATLPKMLILPGEDNVPAILTPPPFTFNLEPAVIAPVVGLMLPPSAVPMARVG